MSAGRRKVKQGAVGTVLRFPTRNMRFARCHAVLSGMSSRLQLHDGMKCRPVAVPHTGSVKSCLMRWNAGSMRHLPACAVSMPARSGGTRKHGSWHNAQLQSGVTPGEVLPTARCTATGHRAPATTHGPPTRRRPSTLPRSPGVNRASPVGRLAGVVAAVVRAGRVGRPGRCGAVALQGKCAGLPVVPDAGEHRGVRAIFGVPNC